MDRKTYFDSLVRQYGEKLYWQVRRIVFFHEDANDVVQNALIKAWINLDSFKNKSSIFTWLSRIAINEALDYMRCKSRDTVVTTDNDAVTASRLLADEYFDGDAVEANLQEAIALLPDVQRVVFTLRYYEEMKYADISKILGTSEGALKASYHIAVKKLEKYLVSS